MNDSTNTGSVPAGGENVILTVFESPGAKSKIEGSKVTHLEASFCSSGAAIKFPPFSRTAGIKPIDIFCVTCDVLETRNSR